MTLGTVGLKPPQAPDADSSDVCLGPYHGVISDTNLYIEYRLASSISLARQTTVLYLVLCN